MMVTATICKSVHDFNNGKTLILPQARSCLLETLDEMGINEENDFAYYLKDFAVPIPFLNYSAWAWADLNTLNWLALRLSELETENLMSRFLRMIDIYDPETEDEVATFLVNVEHCEIYENVENYEQLGIRLAEEIYGIDYDDTISNHIDFYDYGKDYTQSTGCEFIGGACVIGAQTKQVKIADCPKILPKSCEEWYGMG